MSQYFNTSWKTIIEDIESSHQTGLSTSEAKARLSKYGLNVLQTKRKRRFADMFFSQFKSFMIIILVIAAVISGVVGIMDGEGLLDTGIIMGILVLNAFIGAFQEKKAESSLEALKKLSVPNALVLRDGEIKEVSTESLVPGDIVILETGNIVPADIRLIETVNLKIQEASLTGESVPSDKQPEPLSGDDVSLGDQTNMAFSSGMVSYGRGRGVVVATGMNTQVGKIAGMLQETKDTETPMSRRLEQMGKVLGLSALVICALIFVVGILYGKSVLHMFMTAVSLAVAAIPEGLPAVSTVVLAIGVQRLVKKNAIIRTLPSVETLGSATVICSDKTGTLTQNRMTVVAWVVNHQRMMVDTNTEESTLSPETDILLQTAVLCTDVSIHTAPDGRYTLQGDPTETALVDIGLKLGQPKEALELTHPRVAELPFDSERKRMAVVNRNDDATRRVHVKGGLEEVLSVCDRILVQGTIRPFEASDIAVLREINELMASEALRVLAMAFKDIPAGEVVELDSLENKLIFIGMVGMIDPARPEVVEAVATCLSAGIRTIMITGDHKATALAIAKKIGIFKDGDLALSGEELNKMSPEEFEASYRRCSVYARVAPEHKVRIVKSWQQDGAIVAMTGDGVNDAPALKQADIGTAMGIVGTDVAKGASDMILADDNFATIVSAVKEGRRIYTNILKTIQFLLSTNVGEIVLLLVTSIFNLGTPLLPIHILWVNLVTDSLPALALSVDPPESDIMKQQPQHARSGIMTKGMIWRIGYQGFMIGMLPLVAFLIGLSDGGEVLGQTMAFTTLAFAQLVHVNNLHSSKRFSFSFNLLKNKWLLLSILASTLLALVVLLIPQLRDAFGFVAMDAKHWLIIIGLSLVPIPVVDLFKWIRINDMVH